MYIPQSKKDLSLPFYLHTRTVICSYKFVLRFRFEPAANRESNKEKMNGIMMTVKLKLKIIM
jgi:hypothetical protein